MSAAATLWTRVALGTATALVLLLVAQPPQPAARTAPVAAVAAGVVAGAILFAAVARRPPALRARPRPFGLTVARHGFFGLVAATEEIVWRRVVLGELLVAGVVVAVGASAAAFAVVHPARRPAHVATGAVFGGVYVATGALVASIAAHWVYNGLVAALVDTERAP